LEALIPRNPSAGDVVLLMPGEGMTFPTSLRVVVLLL
jgi:hypothetical protein